MMKYEIKIEFENKESLNSLIEKCYFNDSDIEGKLSNSNYSNYLEIESSDNLYSIFKGLTNMTARVTNVDLIEGYMRFVIEESKDFVKLIPCSIHCALENQKYSFY